jgi:hypothetical protein
MLSEGLEVCLPADEVVAGARSGTLYELRDDGRKVSPVAARETVGARYAIPVEVRASRRTVSQ